MTTLEMMKQTCEKGNIPYTCEIVTEYRKPYYWFEFTNSYDAEGIPIAIYFDLETEEYVTDEKYMEFYN